MLVWCRHIAVYIYLDHLECSGSGEYQDFDQDVVRIQVDYSSSEDDSLRLNI